MARYVVINNANIVTNFVLWDGVTPWTPNDYQAVDADGNPVGDPTPQTAILEADLFTPVPEPVVASQPGLISRILSALNPFK